MLPVLPGDAEAAAAMLLALPPEARPRALARALARAEAADRHRRKTGRAHPRWGNGSLTDAVAGLPYRRARFWGEPEYAACFAQVFAALAAAGAPEAPGAPPALDSAAPRPDTGGQ